MKKFKPLQDRILVKRLEEKKPRRAASSSPTRPRKNPRRRKWSRWGRKVTKDGKLQPMGVKVGDTILFGKYSGSEVKLGDEEYLIMREEDVLGILQ